MDTGPGLGRSHLAGQRRMDPAMYSRRQSGREPSLRRRSSMVGCGSPSQSRRERRRCQWESARSMDGMTEYDQMGSRTRRRRTNSWRHWVCCLGATAAEHASTCHAADVDAGDFCTRCHTLGSGHRVHHSAWRHPAAGPPVRDCAAARRVRDPDTWGRLRVLACARFASPVKAPSAERHTALKRSTRNGVKPAPERADARAARQIAAPG
jgi:hypothetical protein